MERNNYSRRPQTGYNNQERREGGYNRGGGGGRGRGGRGGRGGGGYGGDRHGDRYGGERQGGYNKGGYGGHDDSRRGNYDNHDRRPQSSYQGGGGHSFGNKPSKSLVAMSPNPEEAKSQKVVF